MRSGVFGSRGVGGWIRRALKNPTAGGTTGAGYVLAPANLSDGLLVGSDRFDSHPGGATEYRMFFDAATGAFRAGFTTGTQWDAGNRGVGSVAMGNTPIASGANSVAMGNGVTASGNYAVALGQGSSASNTAAVAIGEACSASQSSGCVALGSSATVSGGFGAAAIGQNVTASGTSSLATGNKAVASRTGQRSHTAGRFAADGDAQVSTFVSRNSTTDGTATELFLDGSSARITLAVTRTMAFRIKLAAHRTDVSGTAAAWPQISGAITRDSSGNVRLLGSVTGASTTTLADAGGTTWSVSVTADTTNQALGITVTGEAAKTIRWVAVTEVAEVG